MIGVAGHQAGTHPADLATGTVHLKFGAARQRQHQLVVVVGVLVNLVIQAKQTGIEHDEYLKRAPLRRAPMRSFATAR